MSVDVLQKIGQQELNGAQAYKIGKIINTISSELELYNKTRQQLIDIYCEKDENGDLKFINDNTLQIKEDKITEFNTKINELNNLEVELNINNFTLNDLNVMKLSPREATQISWLINEENPSQ